VELAYMWPSFDNGVPIAATFDAGERRLAADMARYWGSFVRTGHPSARGSSPWLRYDESRLFLSLRTDHDSTLISDRAFAAEHNCAFWDA